METKITRARDDSDVMPTSMYLRIRGLKAVPGEDGLFELQGVKPHAIDHELLAKALGWKFNMTRLLVDRIEC